MISKMICFICKTRIQYKISKRKEIKYENKCKFVRVCNRCY